MSKRKSGLGGTDAFFDDEQQQPKRRGPGRPARPNRSKATFSLDDELQTRLDDAWLTLRAMAPSTAARRKINKSLILEILLSAALDDFEENGEKSNLVALLLDHPEIR